MNTQTTIKEKIQNDSILNNISSYFDNEIYLVGGAVRDILLGKKIFDRDLIVTDENAKDFALMENLYRLTKKIKYIGLF